EAESAGLVPLIPSPDGMGLSIDLGETWGVWGCNTLVEVLTALGVEPGMDLGDVLLLAGSSAALLAAPALLDPGNPEHLRPIVAALRTIEKAYPPGHCDYETIRCARSLLDSEADRLDREQREAQARLERNPQAVE
ncbi:hypothetical protein ACXYTP_24940, partial [Tsukamurella ocularis]